jgi:alpha-beta hydrolase superfamily lysophospholipase
LQRGRRPSRRQNLWLSVTLLLAVLGATGVVWLQPASPDGFYRPPEDLARRAAGEVLRVEPFERGLPAGVEGWRVLYRSTDAAGRPLAVSGLVLQPAEPPTDGRRSLVAIAHGSTGIAEECAPSLSARPLAPLPAVEEALEAGFAVVATDLPGLGTPGPHPYLIGATSAHAVLDSARAAADVLAIAPDDLAVWGFSQGGHAALFAGELAPTYAPELGLKGVVAFAPATDLERMLADAQGTVFGTLLTVNAAVAWSEADPTLDLEDVIEPDSVATARDVAGRCLDGTSLPVSTIQSIRLRDDVAPLDAPTAAAWRPILEANTPTGRIAVPLLVFHGAADPFIDPAITESHVADRCAAGDDVELRIVPGAEHFTLTWRVAEDAVAWTQDRFDGVATSGGC